MAEDAVCVAHAMPGRIRLRVARMRGDSNLATAVEAYETRGGIIDSVRANASSGSVIITYDHHRISQRDVIAAALAGFADLFPDADFETLSVQLGQRSNGGTHNGVHAREPLSSQIRAWFAAVDQTVEGTVEPLTPGAGLRTLLPVSLALLGVARLVSSEKVALPSWYELLWFAFGLFTALNVQAPNGTQARTSLLAAP